MTILSGEVIAQYPYAVHYVTRTLGMSLVGCAPYTHEILEPEQFDPQLDYPIWSVLSHSGQILFSTTDEETAKMAVDQLNFEAAKKVMSSA